MAELVPEVLLVAVTLVHPATLAICHKVFRYPGTLQRYPDIQVSRYSSEVFCYPLTHLMLSRVQMSV